MKYLKKCLIIALVMVTGCIFGQSRKYVLILAKTEQKLVVLNYVTLDTVAKIPVGKDPHEVVTSADGAFAYISNPEQTANGHEIDIVNLKTLALEKKIDTKPFYIPHGLVFLNDRLWFTAQGSKAVVLYNLKEDKVEQVFGTGQDFTHLIYVTPGADRFYTTNVESGTVSIFEKKELPPYMPPTGVLPANAKPRLEWRQTLVNVGYGAEGFDVSADGKELWTARPDGHIVIIDLDKKAVKAEINTNIHGLHRIKITPDGKTVCVVSVKTGDLLFYRKQTHELEQKMSIGQGAGIYMDKDSNRMFISCTPNNYVDVIDLATRKEIKKIAIGRPDGITAVTVD